eukprot:TRINITY_DN1224_c0_g1_i1.p1 TRINITY_DN1224_c0_g1~~TRINITY_DN1224_c0_g1_i1.p1  ORF type:complete len:462 (-),score=69.25 TRINITY_DN1224_c0_g1_i1:64-1449(-)
MALRSTTRRLARNVGLATLRRQVHSSSSSRGDLKQSHVVGEPIAPVLEITYDQLLRDQISLYPHKDLHRAPHENAKLTVTEFKNNVDGLAKGLKDVIGTSQAFASATGLRTEAYISQFGAPRSHNYFIALQPGRTDRIVEELTSVNPRAFLWAPRLGDSVQLDEIYKVFPYLENSGRFEMAPLNDSRFPNLHHLFHNAKKNLPGMSWFKPLIAIERIPDTISGLPSDAHRDASILVTPSMLHLALSQYNIINTANAVGAVSGLNEADITLSTLPVHLAAGQTLGLPMALTRRSQLAIASDVFDATAVLESLNREKCTALVAQPHEWEAIARLPQFAESILPSLKKGIVVSSPFAPVTPAALNSLKAAFRLETVVATFGVDETSGVFLANGKPLPNTELKVVDSTGKILPTGSRGVLLVKGPNVMNGYRNSVDASKKVLSSDKWLNTGMIAAVQPDGHVLLD